MISRWLRMVWVALGAIALVALVALFRMPTRWEVERSAVIAAPPKAIYPLLVELRSWERWSPWREGDYPGMVFTYDGPPRGVGAGIAWDSKTTGRGSRRITAADPPRQVRFELRLDGGSFVAEEVVTVEPDAGGSRVTWRNQGALGPTLLGRLALPALEASLGRDLERALEGLEAEFTGTSGPSQSPPSRPAPDPASADHRTTRGGR